MEAPRVCQGCFREWEGAHDACPCCGWRPKEVYGESFGWKTGDVLEQRYLLGMLYEKTEEAGVWRIYDHVMGISHFVLRTAFKDMTGLRNLGEKMRQTAGNTGHSMKLLSLKKLGDTEALLFSMEEDEGQRGALLETLRSEDYAAEEGKSLTEDIQPEQKKETVLPDGTVLDGRLRILDCIGIGGFGIVYLCEDIPLQRLVAVKEFFPAQWAERDGSYVTVKRSKFLDAYRFGIQSFYKEVKICARFLHTPHVVTVYDAFEENDTVYLVMEYIAGMSAGREMRARDYRPYGPKEMAELLFPVIDALTVIHGQRIVHSDISPANIMRSEDGDVVLIDMGAAKYALDSQPTLSAAFLKPDYAAPEQYRTAKEGIPRDEGAWTDVYALGATMYYLLTGQKPPDVIQRLGSKKPDIILPKGCRLKHARKWAKLLNRAMALERKQRIGSAETLKAAVQELLE